MNKKSYITWFKIIVLSIISIILSFILGAIVCGFLGGLLTTLSMRRPEAYIRGDQALGAGAFIIVGMGIFGLLGGILFALLGQIFVSRRLAKRYGPTLGSHPVLKITLLTWGIIIAAVFLFKTLAF